MSNTQKYNGLVLIDAVNGSGAGNELVIVPTTDANNIGTGDPVIMSAAGYTQIGSNLNVMQVLQGTATAAVYGVVSSVFPQYADGTGNMDFTKVYRAASTKAYLGIRAGNNQDVYEIADDGVLAGLASGHLNYNYKFVASGCDTTFGGSKFTIDSNNGATTATYPLKVIGPSSRPDNDPTAAYAKWRVTLNNVVRSGGTGTVGI